jgi:hypothetical protein
MFVIIKNNMQDATAVVAFTHIPPGEMRNVEQVRYTKWFNGGGHRLLDAGMIAEIHAEAQAPLNGGVIAPARPVEETVPDAFTVPTTPSIEEAEPDAQPDTPAAADDSAPKPETETETEAHGSKRKRR